MNKTILIFTIALLVLCSFASADWITDNLTSTDNWTIGTEFTIDTVNGYAYKSGATVDTGYVRYNTNLTSSNETIIFQMVSASVTDHHIGGGASTCIPVGTNRETSYQVFFDSNQNKVGIREFEDDCSTIVISFFPDGGFTPNQVYDFKIIVDATKGAKYYWKTGIANTEPADSGWTLFNDTTAEGDNNGRSRGASELFFHVWGRNQDANNRIYFLKQAIPPSLIPVIDLLFSNETDTTTYKALFDEGERFHVYANYTLSNGSIITNESASCNISLVGGLVEIPGDFDNFTLCDSGCNFSSRIKEFDFETTINAVNDSIHFDGCHEQTASGNIEINISCGAGSEIVTVLASEMPLCSSGTAFVRKTSNVCIGSERINISTDTAGNIPFSQRKRILNAAADREYSVDVNIYPSFVFFNETLGLWQTSHTHIYHAHGSKEIFVNCTHSNASFSIDRSENITIVNLPPQIFIDQVETSLGITALSEGVSIEFANGTWSWLIAVIDDDLDFVNYSWFNSSGDLLFNFTANGTPESINTSSDLFVDFDGNPFNLTVFANDTFGNSTTASITFVVNDTINPSCNFPSSFRIETGDNLNFNVNCADENFFSLNVSCPANNFSFFVDGLNVQSYLFNQSINSVLSDTCAFEYCDGHTSSELEKNWDVILENNTMDYYIDYEKAVQIWVSEPGATFTYEKKTDRISYSINFKNDIKSTYVSLFLKVSARSYLLESDKYDYWIADSINKIWHDLNGIKGNVIPIKHTDGLWEFKVFTKEKEWNLDSIGEFICISGSFDISVVLDTEATNEFTSIQQALFWMFLIMLWVVFVILTFTVKGAHGHTVGLFNMFQGFLGIAVGIGFMQFSVLVGLLIVLVAAFIMVGKAMEAKNI